MASLAATPVEVLELVATNLDLCSSGRPALTFQPMSNVVEPVRVKILVKKLRMLVGHFKANLLSMEEPAKDSFADALEEHRFECLVDRTRRRLLFDQRFTGYSDDQHHGNLDLMDEALVYLDLWDDVFSSAVSTRDLAAMILERCKDYPCCGGIDSEPDPDAVDWICRDYDESLWRRLNYWILCSTLT